jgi:hypothetical protein
MRSLKERYPPAVLEKAKNVSQKLLDEAMERGGESDQTEKPALDDTTLELMLESDRGCVLVAAAWMDELVTKITTDLFAWGDKENQEAGKSLMAGIHAPLGTAWARETLLFALGVISEDLWNGLGALRKLRNRYAHRKTPATLTAAEIEPLLKTFPDEGRAKIDYISNQLGGVFDTFNLMDDLPFGLRFAPSSAKILFIFSVHRLRTTIELGAKRILVGGGIGLIFKVIADMVRAGASRNQSQFSDSDSKDATK